MDLNEKLNPPTNLLYDLAEVCCSQPPIIESTRITISKMTIEKRKLKEVSMHPTCCWGHYLNHQECSHDEYECDKVQKKHKLRNLSAMQLKRLHNRIHTFEKRVKADPSCIHYMREISYVPECFISEFFKRRKISFF